MYFSLLNTISKELAEHEFKKTSILLLKEKEFEKKSLTLAQSSNNESWKLSLRYQRCRS